MDQEGDRVALAFVEPDRLDQVAVDGVALCSSEAELLELAHLCRGRFRGVQPGHRPHVGAVARHREELDGAVQCVDRHDQAVACGPRRAVRAVLRDHRHPAARDIDSEERGVAHVVGAGVDRSGVGRPHDLGRRAVPGLRQDALRARRAIDQHDSQPIGLIPRAAHRQVREQPAVRRIRGPGVGRPAVAAHAPRFGPAAR